MANRKHLIRVVTTAGDTTGFSEFVAGSTDGGPLIPSFTTTQRDAISSATTGEVIFNSSTSKVITSKPLPDMDCQLTWTHWKNLCPYLNCMPESLF